MSDHRRALAGAALALAGIAALSAAMIPLRSHLSVATSALVLVVPVVAGVAAGGFAAGAVAVLAGFLAYDFFFIPPYHTLSVGEVQNWVALIVYAAVMLVVARVVANLRAARAAARRHEEDTRRLFELSDVLIADQPMPELLKRIVATVKEAFALRSVALLLPEDGTLAVAACAGEPLSASEVAAAMPVGGAPRAAGVLQPSASEVVALPLSATGRPLGVLALLGARLSAHEWGLLRTHANQAALALERGQLREQALRSELLEEVDRWRSALMGAVSHDLRTPLASVKAAVSALRREDAPLGAQDVRELLELIETQSDRLARLVTNLLDMTRIQSGALELHRAPVALDELVSEALGALGLSPAHRVALDLPADLPLVDVDHVLVGQVLANLLENADRYAPEETAITVGARALGDRVEVRVVDRGPGVPARERDRVFEMFNRVSGAGRAGLGLAIAKSFVEAHGQSIHVEDRPGGGAQFVFFLPRADLEAGPE